MSIHIIEKRSNYLGIVKNGIFYTYLPRKCLVPTYTIEILYEILYEHFCIYICAMMVTTCFGRIPKSVDLLLFLEFRLSNEVNIKKVSDP